MKVCIIGGGPSGFFLAKYLSPFVSSVTIYEKNKDFGGNYKYSANPKYGIFKKTLSLDNVKYIPNYEVTTNNFNEIEGKYDKFVIATGGIPIIKPDSGYISAMDVIMNITPINKLGQKLCIIGMGNVALDACRKLINRVKEIDIVSRSSLYLSKFGNKELRDIKELAVIEGHNITKPINEKEKRRYNLIKNTHLNEKQTKTQEEDQPNTHINLRFNTTVKNVTKQDDKYCIEYNTGEKFYYDSIISSFGFKPNPIKLETNKPVYKIGWCKKAWGNINDALHDAKDLATKILKI